MIQECEQKQNLKTLKLEISPLLLYKYIKNVIDFTCVYFSYIFNVKVGGLQLKGCDFLYMFMFLYYD